MFIPRHFLTVTVKDSRLNMSELSYRGIAYRTPVTAVGLSETDVVVMYRGRRYSPMQPASVPLRSPHLQAVRHGGLWRRNLD